MKGIAGLRYLTAGCLAAVALAAVASPDDSRARVQYVHHCSGCHLADGSGAPTKGIPSMRGTLGLFLQVPGGREYVVQVPGVMNSPLSDDDVANLMNWILPMLAADTTWANAAPYTAEEIARLRRSRPLDVAAVRAELLDRICKAGVARHDELVR